MSTYRTARINAMLSNLNGKLPKDYGFLGERVDKLTIEELQLALSFMIKLLDDNGLVQPYMLNPTPDE